MLNKLDSTVTVYAVLNKQLYVEDIKWTTVQSFDNVESVDKNFSKLHALFEKIVCIPFLPSSSL